jgi:predicted aspartyl protease
MDDMPLGDRGNYASALMVEAGAEATAEMMLQEADFPPNFVHMAHPGDRIQSNTPIETEYIEHQGSFGHHRLIVRVSFRLQSGQYVPLSFVVDTGAPFHFYLADEAVSILKQGNRLVQDEVGTDYMNVLGRKVLVHETPTTHKPANIIGLKMLKIVGLQYHGDSFFFVEQFTHF